MILRLVLFPDDRLRQESEPVRINDETDLGYMQQVLDSMVETCRHVGGLGLSAIQIGIPSRMFVVVTEEDALYIVNPEITYSSLEKVETSEGCLSFPGVYAQVERPERVKIKYHDYNFEEKELEASGMVGRCILHEYDHLDGKVFTDLLKPMARDVANRKSKKKKKEIERFLRQQAAVGTEDRIQ